MWKIVHESGRRYLFIDTPVETHYLIPEPATRLDAIEAVMMDMDGSSTDTEKLVLEAMRRMMADSLGRDDFAFAPGDFAHIVGDSTTNHVTWLVRKYGLDPARRDDYIALYYKYYHQTLSDIRDGKRDEGLIEPMPHLGEFLTWARARGLKIGIVTSSIEWELDIVMTEVFKRLGWSTPFKEFYDATIGADAVGEPFLKPHPNLYVLMAEKLGVAPGRAVVVEDSTAGILAGRVAGFSVAAVPHHHTEGHSFDMADLGVMEGGLAEVREVLEGGGGDTVKR